jgi:hypothetical protein
MTTEPSPDLILGEIERIGAGRAFQRALRQRSLLSYLVIEAQEGRADHLKEYSIGIAVFSKERRVGRRNFTTGPSQNRA